VGFGGGSPMDVAKVVSYLSHPECTQELSELYGVGNCTGQRLPLLQVPTTAGTGSEVTPISIITTGENSKMGVVSPQLLPDWAVIDGELTTSVPPVVTAATGIDAMVHAIEAYTSRIKKNPLSDVLAREALTLLGSNIRTVCEDGTNAEARGEMLLGSMYAGMAFANAPVGAVHALAYPVGSFFHVSHGLSNSLMLPHVLRHNIGNEPRAAQLYSEIAELAFPELAEEREENLAEGLAACFADLARDLGVATQLRDVGIEESDLELLSTEAMKQTRLLPNNIAEVDLAAARSLYRQAF